MFEAHNVVAITSFATHLYYNDTLQYVAYGKKLF